MVVMAVSQISAHSPSQAAGTKRTLTVELLLADEAGLPIPAETPVHITLRTLYDGVVATRATYGAEHVFEGLPWPGNAAADVTANLISTHYLTHSVKLPSQTRGTTNRARLVLRPRGTTLIRDDADSLRSQHPHIARALARPDSSPNLDAVPLHPLARINLLTVLTLFEILHCDGRQLAEDVVAVANDPITISSATLLIDQQRVACWSSTMVARVLPPDITMSARRTPTGREITLKVRDVYATVTITIDESTAVTVGAVTANRAVVDVGYGGNISDHTPLALRGLLESISTEWPIRFSPPDRWVATPSATLWQAAVVGDAAAVTLRLRSGADPRQKFGDYPPIWAALGARNTEAARILWQAAPIPEALVWAADADAADLLRIMLADTRVPNRDPSLPFQALLRTAQRGRVAALEILLRSGVDPSRPPSGWTNSNALAEAVANRRASSVRLLLAAGMDPNTEYRARDLDSENSVSYRPLQHASGLGDLETVRALVDAGANIDWDEGIALRLAASRGHDLVVAELLRRGARVDTSLGAEGSALLGAAKNGDERSVRLLLAAGANPNSRNRGGLTPLYSAALHGNTEVMKALLDAGAGVDQPTSVGLTPLAAAVFDNAADAVRILLAHGANPNLKYEGQTLIEHAASRGNTAALEALGRRGPALASNPPQRPTYKTRRAMLRESPLFAEAEALLPAGAGADVELQQRFQLLATGILAEYQEQADFIRGRFKTNRIDRIRVTVDDLGVATALARRDADGYDIRIDPRLVRAALSAALETRLDDVFVVDAEAQLAALKAMRHKIRLLYMVDAVENITVIRGPTSVSLSGDDIFNPAGLKAITEFDRVRARLEAIERAYMGSLMFVVAHELAHAALGHLGNGNDECSTSQNAELDADKLAAMLLARTFIAVSTDALDIDGKIKWFVDPDALRAHTGHVAFFGPVFERAGRSGDSCLYPSTRERSAAAEQMFQEVMKHEGADVVESMRRGLQRSALLTIALGGNATNTLSAWLERLRE
jgi:ankyrin repeat protein